MKRWRKGMSRNQKPVYESYLETQKRRAFGRAYFSPEVYAQLDVTRIPVRQFGSVRLILAAAEHQQPIGAGSCLGREHRRREEGGMEVVPEVSVQQVVKVFFKVKCLSQGLHSFMLPFAALGPCAREGPLLCDA
eukprot:1149111-Pelagomonas_calceolata.AAC.3